MTTPLVEIVEGIAPPTRRAISSIVVKGREARLTYAAWAGDDHDALSSSEMGEHEVSVDWDRLIDSGFRGRVAGRSRAPDTVHPLPAYTPAVLESWIADLEGSGLVGGLRVDRGHGGQVGIGTHWSTAEERADWLRSLDG